MAAVSTSSERTTPCSTPPRRKRDGKPFAEKAQVSKSAICLPVERHLTATFAFDGTGVGLRLVPRNRKSPGPRVLAAYIRRPLATSGAMSAAGSVFAARLLLHSCALGSPFGLSVTLSDWIGEAMPRG